MDSGSTSRMCRELSLRKTPDSESEVPPFPQSALHLELKLLIIILINITETINSTWVRNPQNLSH